MKTSKKGFTLIELVIVIVIVAILSIVAVPTYRVYIRKSTLTEGKTLLKNIEVFEHIYYAEFREYIDVNKTNISTALDSESRSNKYFKTFEVKTSDNESFTATTYGVGTASGITLTLISPARDKQSYFIETGLSDQN